MATDQTNKVILESIMYEANYKKSFHCELQHLAKYLISFHIVILCKQIVDKFLFTFDIVII